MNYEEQFENWLSKKFGEENGTKSSYIKALQLLSNKINKNIFQMNQKNEILVLYQDVKKEQKIENGKFYHIEAPSYGLNGFYSAALKSYLAFLETRKNG